MDNQIKEQLLRQIGELVVNSAKKNLTAQGIDDNNDVLLRNSLTYRLDGPNSVIIGTPLYWAVWREYGTGSYAVHGDGRPGYWIYVTGPIENMPSIYVPSAQPVRHKSQAYAIMFSMNDKFEQLNLPYRAHVSHGEPARPFLQPALDNNKQEILQLITDTLKESMGNIK